MPTHGTVAKLVLLYLLLNAAWVLLFSFAVGHLAHDHESEDFWELIDGIVGAFLTAAFLALALCWYGRQIRRANHRIEESEARLRVVGDNLPESYVYEYLVDTNGQPHFTYVSAGVERVHGVPAAEVLRDARTILRQIDDAQAAAHAEAVARSGQTFADFRMELRIVRADGVARVILVQSSPRRGDDGAIVWDGFVSDVTDQKRSELALQQSEERFRKLVETAPEAIFIRTKERFSYVNAAAVRLFGAPSPSALLDKPVEDRFPPESRPAIREHMRMTDETGRATLNAESVMLRLDGARVHVSLSAAPFFYRDSPGTLIFARDVSERKQAEAALRQNQKLLTEMERMAKVGGWSFDPATGRGEWTEEVARIHDLDPSVPPSKEMGLSFYSGESRVRIEAAVAEAVTKGTPYDLELEFTSAKGVRKWVRTNCQPVIENGKVVKVFGSFQDITERRKGEEDRNRLGTALDQAAESIVITDLAGLIQYVNPAFERITGFSRPEVIGKKPAVLKSGRHDAAFYQQLWATLLRGEVWRGHFINKRKNGQLFEEEATITPVRDASGKIDHYMAIKLDVTREVVLEGQFLQAQKMEAIGQLAGGVAHDFNNILTSILMQVELGDMEFELPPDVRDGLKQIRSDAERAASLTRQLLLFSRRQIMQTRDLDLNAVVTNLTRMLQRIIGEDVRLRLNLHPAPLMTRADAGMLDQVAMNLAVNARDAMREGGRLTIETSEFLVDEAFASLHADAAPGRYVRLCVSDTGVGIPPEVLPRIFEPFFTTKEAGKGTGLGLATVFGIVKQHRGWLAVESEPGRGSTFSVNIPALDQANQGEAPVAQVKPGGWETVLLVEDDNVVRMSLRKILAQKGYHVIEAGNGAEALKLWPQHREAVQLLLTDLVMPGGIHGPELARQMKAEKPALKVLFASGYSPEIAGKEIKLEPGEAFIQKPPTCEELLKAVRQCLDG